MFFGYLTNNDMGSAKLMLLEAAKNWKQAFVDTQRKFPHQDRGLANATTVAQLESKMWIIEELQTLKIEPKSVCILAGWYSNFLTPLLFEKMNVDFIHNFEMDNDVKEISYKFNKRYKIEKRYKCDIVNVMFDSVWKKQKIGDTNFDMIVNTSCEHMFPMRKFREINMRLSGNPIYVLQSTDDDQYDDHINCVSDPEELANQANFSELLYGGTKVLNSGMKRFMVIGR